MATEKRLIEANALLACFEAEYKQSTYPYFHMDEIADEIIKAPTVDAMEVVHGQWVNNCCSNCNTICTVNVNGEEIVVQIKSDYCPNCGAKMDGDGNG